jgi:hypothetical protein
MLNRKKTVRIQKNWFFFACMPKQTVERGLGIPLDDRDL